MSSLFDYGELWEALCRNTPAMTRKNNATMAGADPGDASWTNLTLGLLRKYEVLTVATTEWVLFLYDKLR